MKRLASVLVLTSMLTVGAVFIACDGDDSTPTLTNKDAGGTDTSTGSDTGTGGETSTGTQQIGKVTELGANGPSIPNATVSIAGKTATTNNKGEYTIDVPTGTPFQMRITAQDHYSVLEQEWSVAATSDRGKTTLISTAAATILLSSLPGIDDTKGAVAIIVGKTGACADTTGSLVNVTCNGGSCLPVPDAGAGEGGAEGGTGDGGGDGGGLGLGPRHPFIAYFRGGVPNGTATDVDGAEAVSALAYNLPLTGNLELKVAKPAGNCSAKAYPVTVPGDNNTGAFTYTGKFTVEPANGKIVSAARVFLQ